MQASASARKVLLRPNLEIARADDGRFESSQDFTLLGATGILERRLSGIIICKDAGLGNRPVV